MQYTQHKQAWGCFLFAPPVVPDFREFLARGPSAGGLIVLDLFEK